jgi:prepilin-type N-terminal cleavage/methylation domain-containing protein
MLTGSRLGVTLEHEKATPVSHHYARPRWDGWTGRGRLFCGAPGQFLLFSLRQISRRLLQYGRTDHDERLGLPPTWASCIQRCSATQQKPTNRRRGRMGLLQRPHRSTLRVLFSQLWAPRAEAISRTQYLAKSLGSALNPAGFTLIELMIVVAIGGILAGIAIPKFAGMVARSQAAQTKGNMGAVRSALSIYYSENQGVYPANIYALTTGSKYITSIPPALLPEGE